MLRARPLFARVRSAPRKRISVASSMSVPSAVARTVTVSTVASATLPRACPLESVGEVGWVRTASPEASRMTSMP